MVDISIIIVNYNVKHFLAQCLTSILNSIDNHLKVEIIVVDNASVDGSFPFLENKFGDKVTFIRNEKNVGFGKACNIGLVKAKGEFVLFLNPDTLIPPGTLENCIEQMRTQHSENVAALGVKIIDGGGNFLPESKRSLPSVWNSFCKMSGLASLFPKYSLMGGYNLTFLPDNEVAQVEALCGAFMLVRKNILDEIGGFDEQFFMYGEDLDLCKRIKERGKTILYYPNVHIVHFKGESQKSKDFRYYRQFYSAMSIYADKHFSIVLSFLLRIGIFLAGSIAFLTKLMIKHLPKIFDLLAMIGLVYMIKLVWAIYIKGDRTYYNEGFEIYAFTFPIIVFISLLFSGYYNQKSTTRNLTVGYLTGVGGSLAVYALFPENLRFSRSILLLFLFLAPATIFFVKTVLNRLFNTTSKRAKRAAFIGSEKAFKEFKRWSRFLDTPLEIVGKINDQDENSISNISNLGQTLDFYNIDELIFDSGDAHFKYIYAALIKYGKKVKFRIAGEKDFGVIGSDRSDIAGKVYLIDFDYRINRFSSKILKRIFDILTSAAIIITFPVWLFFKSGILKEAFRVFRGQNTWIGYVNIPQSMVELPKIKPGIYSIIDISPNSDGLQMDFYEEQNIRYAKNYSIFVDLELFLKHLFAL